MPELYKQYVDIAKKLEKGYKDVQDMEFTIERGKLYILQTRNGKRTAAAAVRIAVEMEKEGIISKERAVELVDPYQLYQLLLPSFDTEAKKESVHIATGLAASPGAAVGKIVFDTEEAAARGANGEKVILVRIETCPDDIHGMIASQGVLTLRGGMTSHAAVVAKGMGKPCVAGAEDLVIDLKNETLTVKTAKFIIRMILSRLTAEQVKLWKAQLRLLLLKWMKTSSSCSNGLMKLKNSQFALTQTPLQTLQKHWNSVLKA